MEPEGFNMEIYGYHSGDFEEYNLAGCDSGKVLLPDYMVSNSRKYYSFIILLTNPSTIPSSQPDESIRQTPNIYFLIVLNFSQIAVLWDVTPCSLVDRCRYSGRIYNLNYKCRTR
jgi:hypothetical protein